MGNNKKPKVPESYLCLQDLDAIKENIKCRERQVKYQRIMRKNERERALAAKQKQKSRDAVHDTSKRTFNVTNANSKVRAYFVVKGLSLFDVLPPEIILQILEIFYNDLHHRPNPETEGNLLSYNPLEALHNFSLASRRACLLATSYIFRNITLSNIRNKGLALARNCMPLLVRRPRISTSVRRLTVQAACTLCCSHPDWHLPTYLSRIHSVVLAVCNNITQLAFDYQCTCNYGNPIVDRYHARQRKFLGISGLSLLFELLNSYDYPRCRKLICNLYQLRDSGHDERIYGDDMRSPFPKFATLFWRNMKSIPEKRFSVYLGSPSTFEVELMRDMMYGSNTRVLQFADIDNRDDVKHETIEPMVLLPPGDPADCILQSLSFTGIGIPQGKLLALLESLPRLQKLEIVDTELLHSTYTGRLLELLSQKDLRTLKVDNIARSYNAGLKMGLSEMEQKLLVGAFEKVKDRNLRRYKGKAECMCEVFVDGMRRSYGQAKASRLSGVGGVFGIFST